MCGWCQTADGGIHAPYCPNGEDVIVVAEGKRGEEEMDFHVRNNLHDGFFYRYGSDEWIATFGNQKR